MDADGTIHCSKCRFQHKDATRFIPARDSSGMALCRVCDGRERMEGICCICEQRREVARIRIKGKMVCWEDLGLLMQMKSDLDEFMSKVHKWEEDMRLKYNSSRPPIKDGG